MARNEKKPIDREAHLARLARIAEATINPPTFKVGDLVTENLDILGLSYQKRCEDKGVYPVCRVLDVNPSWRQVSQWSGHSADMVQGFPECQALFVTAIDEDGDCTMQWVPARTYVLAPRELISLAPEGSLNH